MNYIDGRYVDDYTAEDDGRRYAVTLEQLAREYQRNPKLRQLEETGEYVYVGGYLVRFSPESVRLENGKYRLTDTARMQISRYCIGQVTCPLVPSDIRQVSGLAASAISLSNLDQMLRYYSKLCNLYIGTTLRELSGALTGLR